MSLRALEDGEVEGEVGGVGEDTSLGKELPLARLGAEVDPLT